MTVAPVWLMQAAVLALHERSIREHGGSMESATKDFSSLRSLVRKTYSLTAIQIFSTSAAYAFGISRNHAFVDGDKRTGFLAAYAFLLRNGVTLTATEEDATGTMLQLAAGDMTEAEFSAWLQRNTQAV